jgi:hypothetical protein
MIPENEVCYVFIEIIRYDESGYGVGAELSRKVDGRYEAFTIMSLFYPTGEFPSKRQLLFHLFNKTFRYVPDEDKLIVFCSSSPYFKDNNFQLQDKAGIYANGRDKVIRHLRRKPSSVMSLARDAVKRGDTIIEEL